MSSTRECQACGNEMSAFHQKCRSCGAPYKPSTSEWAAGAGCLAVLALVGAATCSSDADSPGTTQSAAPTPVDISTPEKLATHVLSKREANSSNGLLEEDSTPIQINGREIFVQFQFIQSSLFKGFEEELGHVLAPKFKELMDGGDYFDTAIFNVSCSYEDPLGGYKMHPTVRVFLNRDLFEKIKWAEFDPKFLLPLAEEVRWFRKL